MGKSKPRGFYTDKSYLKWSKDQETGYFNTPQMLYWWPLAKVAVLVVVFAFCKYVVGCWHLGVLVCIPLTMFYQHLVALLIPNTIVMPVMDSMCLISSE